MTAQRIDPILMRQGLRGNRALLSTIALAVLSAYAVLLQAVCLARLINGICFQRLALSAIMPWTAALAALFLLRAGLTHAGEIAAFHATARIKTLLREALLARHFALGPLRRGNTAESATVLLEGVEALEPYFSRYLPQMVLCVAVPLAILALVFPLDLYSGLILLVAGPLIPVFMVLVGYRAEALNQRQWQKLLRLGAHFLDALQGLTTLKLFGRARDEIAIARKISEDYRRSAMQGLRVAFLTSAVLEFFASLGIALIAVLFGARLIHGHIAFYPAFLVLLLAPEFFAPLRGLSVHYHARMTAIAAARQIFTSLETGPPTQGAPLADARSYEITCKELCFGYAGTPVLSAVSARFPAASLTVLVGESGAGKTTLARLLVGFAAPDSGQVLLNGADLGGIAKESWWERLAWVPQAPRLFAGSIAENLRIARAEATLAQMREACRRARALEFIEALPGKFDSPIGENGAGLSGGQIQRLALARAFLKDPHVLILDEATASLDSETEAEIIAALREAARERTVIAIAHRLALAAAADQVLVLSEGRIVQSGPPGVLRTAPGPYRALSLAWGEMPCAS